MISFRRSLALKRRIKPSTLRSTLHLCAGLGRRCGLALLLGIGLGRRLGVGFVRVLGDQSMQSIKDRNPREDNQRPIWRAQKSVPHDMKTVGVQSPPPHPYHDLVGVAWGKAPSGKAKHQDEFTEVPSE